MAKTTYEWRAPWLYKGINAEKVQREIAKISTDGAVDPEDVLAFAKDHPKSELAKAFEWDTRTAANKWRLHQARVLLGNLRKVTIQGGEVTLERTHFHVSGEGYVSKDRLTKDPIAREQVLHQARKALEELPHRSSSVEPDGGVDGEADTTPEPAP